MFAGSEIVTVVLGGFDRGRKIYGDGDGDGGGGGGWWISNG